MSSRLWRSTLILDVCALLYLTVTQPFFYPGSATALAGLAIFRPNTLIKQLDLLCYKHTAINVISLNRNLVWSDEMTACIFSQF